MGLATRGPKVDVQIGPCKGNPDKGGFACCRDESCHTQTPGPPRTYRFEYNVTYRRVLFLL